MSIYSALDRHSFQQLLANAYAVQESQINSQSLSVIVELERLISKGELDVDGTMHLIVDLARHVANATGVAIGLLQGDQLVYNAGSGTGSAYIGQSVMATLSVPPDTKPGRELLRVENAETDARIEAEICRQFGAQSLLIMLIYQDRAVAGVLEVFFAEAHAFEEREVRAYRLMAGLIGDAMSQAAHIEQKESLEAEAREIEARNTAVNESWLTELSITVPPPEATAAPEQEFLPDKEFSPVLPVTPPAVVQPHTDSLPAPAAVDLPAIRKVLMPAVLTRMPLKAAKRSAWYQRSWTVDAVAIAAVLLLTFWIAYSERRPASPVGSMAPQTSTTGSQDLPFPSAKDIVLTSASEIVPAAAPTKPVNSARKSRTRRLRADGIEVEHIGNDVTIRHFNPKPSPQATQAGARKRAGDDKVAYIGDDVTVRYFGPKSTAPAGPIGKATRSAGAARIK